MQELKICKFMISCCDLCGAPVACVCRENPGKDGQLCPKSTWQKKPSPLSCKDSSALLHRSDYFAVEQDILYVIRIDDIHASGLGSDQYTSTNESNKADSLTDNSNSASFTWLASPLVLTSNPRN